MFGLFAWAAADPPLARLFLARLVAPVCLHFLAGLAAAALGSHLLNIKPSPKVPPTLSLKFTASIRWALAGTLLSWTAGRLRGFILFFLNPWKLSDGFRMANCPVCTPEDSQQWRYDIDYFPTCVLCFYCFFFLHLCVSCGCRGDFQCKRKPCLSLLNEWEDADVLQSLASQWLLCGFCHMTVWMSVTLFILLLSCYNYLCDRHRGAAGIQAHL